MNTQSPFVVRKWAHNVIRRFGFDVRRVSPDPYSSVIAQIISREVDVVIDVGANVGDFGALLRSKGFRGSIFSFEPVLTSFLACSSRASSDPNWHVLRLALGSRNGEDEMRVTSGDAAASSFFKLGSRHLDAAPGITETRIERVPTITLDQWLKSATQASKSFLKIDVQGSELEVLRGSSHALQTSILGLLVEVSVSALYEGAPTHCEILAFLEDFNFRMDSAIAGFADPFTGLLLQYDALAWRKIPG